MEIMIVFISFYKYKNNLLYLIFYGYCYGIFHICHKNWKIRENDTERRSLFKIDWPQKKNESTHHKIFSLICYNSAIHN